MPRPILTIVLICCYLFSVAQSDTLYKPVSVTDLFKKYDAHLAQSKKDSIKILPVDSLRNTSRWEKGLLDGFDYSLVCKMAEDLEESGIRPNSDDYYYLLLACYHRYLNNEDIQLEVELKYYADLREERQKLYEEALKRDSVDGKYIPSNLVDCFIELDKILSPKHKRSVKKHGRELHMSLGMYLRNRWQLWGAGRLKKYFLDLNGGFMHPDSMSGVILKYYQKWLQGERDAWREWEMQQWKWLQAQ
ncbi:MAG: DUF6794 domain-containing protein [Chitinophagaceae bacterium]